MGSHDKTNDSVVPSDRGIFTISLDFELYWGVRDKRTIEEYGANIIGARSAIPKILELFVEFNVHATWAAVGFLFFTNRNELKKSLPNLFPEYTRSALSPYPIVFQEQGDHATIPDPYLFAPDLIDTICAYPGQEIGTHTFSHYYCLEKGQTVAQFQADLNHAASITRKKCGYQPRSLVFPRNQWNSHYLHLLPKAGIHCFRGNELSWIYQASEDEGQGYMQRALRLLDTYFNISGYNTYNLPDCRNSVPNNFPASRFLRPYSRKLAFLDSLRLKRITSSMNDAAIRQRLFHLWWHPHNFGINTEKNLDFLRKILLHFKTLQQRHDMMSLNMGELSSLSVSHPE
ncbi:MAG: polysaccharide deacetylase family protein [Magnetococcus sp. YQC-9]